MAERTIPTVTKEVHDQQVRSLEVNSNCAQSNWTTILTMAKELFVTMDMEVAAEMLQSRKWIAVNSTYKPDGISWTLIRV